MYDHIPGKASAAIQPYRFVRYSGAYTFTQASAATQADVVGISGADAEDAPLSGADTDHASTGKGIQLHQPGQICLLEAGNSFSAGAFLMTDGSGRGITATSTNYINARALEASNAAGEKVRVQVLPTRIAP